MTKKFKYMFNDFKMEIIAFFIMSIFLCIFSEKLKLSVYFTENRLSNIKDFFSIIIGIYITVVTILGISVIGITKEILEKKLDTRLINVIMFGIIEALLSIVIITFIESKWNDCYYYILFYLSTTTLITFSKFIYLLSLLFKVNLNFLAKNIDQVEKDFQENEAYKKNIYEILENLEKDIKKIKELRENQ